MLVWHDTAWEEYLYWQKQDKKRSGESTVFSRKYCEIHTWALGSRNLSKEIYPVSGAAESMRRIDLCIGLSATIAKLRSAGAITTIDPAFGLS
jgi:hypothetical protein